MHRMPLSAYSMAIARVIIDTPPSLGILTVNALVASQEVIVPVAMSTFALIGLRLLEDSIAQLRENLDLNELHILGAVGTFSDRTNVSRNTLAVLQASTQAA